MTPYTPKTDARERHVIYESCMPKYEHDRTVFKEVFSDLAQAESALARVQQLEEVIRHCQIHCGFRNCGYVHMTTEQKAIYDEVAKEWSSWQAAKQTATASEVIGVETKS